MKSIYDTEQSWRWNLENAPPMQQPVAAVPVPGAWSWCGLPVASPLGIAAGPLLNSGWLSSYARRGFDVLVYKTVRTMARECYPLPNLVPVETDGLADSGSTVPQSTTMRGSWAVSFGMPSQAPDDWRRDVAAARNGLGHGQVLVVSIVGTQDESVSDPDECLTRLADDFALCAKWAADSGAHGIEANFSCPNVSTADGQLFQQPSSAAFVARAIREAIGRLPLVLKIGRLESESQIRQFIQEVGPCIDGLAMTNSISARVQSTDGRLLFDGQSRGICGEATRNTSVSQTAEFRRVLDETGVSMDLIGVGGISTAEHVREYLDAGATSVALATSAMVDPDVGTKIRAAMSE